MNAGDTFLVIDGTDDHLWVVISDPSQDPDQIVIVMLCSWQAEYDQACVLYAGEHPFVKHPTCVQYPAAEITSRAILESKVKHGKVKPKEPFGADVLLRMQKAVESSDIPIKAYRVMNAQGFVP